MTKLEVGYLVWGIFVLCIVIPECLAYFGKSFTRSRARRERPRTSRPAGRSRR